MRTSILPIQTRRLDDARVVSVFIQSLLMAVGILVFLNAMRALDFTTAVYGVLFVYLANLLYAFRRLTRRLLFLFLHAGIFLFWLTRPLVPLLDASRTWAFDRLDTNVFVLTAVFATLLALFAGSAAFDMVKEWRRSKGKSSRVQACELRDTVKSVASSRNDSFEEKRLCIRWAALVLFVISLAGSYVQGLIMLSYMEGMRYEDFYLIDSSDHVPWVVSVLADMTLYAFCAYLATLPRKRPTIAAMLLFVATTVPMLMIGSRSDFVIACLFGVLYYLFRHVSDKEERWIGRAEISLAAVCVPVGIFAMGLMNYTRAGVSADMNGFFGMIFDALFKQGVTFSVLGYGYQVDPQVQDLGFRFFSIGSFITNIRENFIGQEVLGLASLGDTNSALLALNGNSYAHTMSYFAHKNYLGGEGYGSSYVLELYADFGFWGIIVGSFLIAIVLAVLSESLKKSWFWGMVALVGAQGVFHMPRGSVVDFISFIWTTRFIGTLVVLIALAALLYFLLSERRKMQRNRVAISCVVPCERRDSARSVTKSKVVTVRARSAVRTVGDELDRMENV